MGEGYHKHGKCGQAQDDAVHDRKPTGERERIDEAGYPQNAQTIEYVRTDNIRKGDRIFFFQARADRGAGLGELRADTDNCYANNGF